ncbi:MAG TPA: class I SAM-dependent methyltransferase [Novosphingobium sp.]|nr:class I SAM-dependent methyltransferase [Novosphingobium sp.]
MIKSLVKRTPVVRDIARAVLKLLVDRRQKDFVSGDYWENRYKAGGNSGAGSYNRLAEHKAEVLNGFVADHGVQTVIEFGSGDGAQLTRAHYPDYTGVDISHTALDLTRKLFAGDPTKRFLHPSELPDPFVADLTLSLDVVYHLIEDSVFEAYMAQLFDASRRYVIVYSSNTDRKSDAVHVRHRRFTDWVEANRPEFALTGVVRNPYPEDQDTDNTSFADFYFFEKPAAAG